MYLTKLIGAVTAAVFVVVFFITFSLMSFVHFVCRGYDRGLCIQMKIVKTSKTVITLLYRALANALAHPPHTHTHAAINLFAKAFVDNIIN